MSVWMAALLGLVQGLTEFLPISSTAHLRITSALFGHSDVGGAAFTAVIQLGTLIAVVGYFARDVFVTMPKALLTDRTSPEGRLPIYLVLGTVPVAVIGLTFKDFIEGDARSLYVISGALIAVGLLFFVVERVGKKTRVMAEITLLDAMLVGLAQTCALVPGVSRSGATIACALLLGFRRSDSARFSFLLGVPAIAGAGIFEMKAALSQLGEGAWLPIVIGTTTAAISGYATIAWLLRFLSHRSLATFGVYRVLLGLVLLGLCIGGVLAPGSGP